MTWPLEPQKAPVCGEGGGNELAAQSSVDQEFLSSKPNGWSDHDWQVHDVMLRGGIFVRHISQRLTPLVVKAQRSGRLIDLSRSSLLRDGELSDVRYGNFCGRFCRQPKLNKKLRRQLEAARGSILLIHCGIQLEYAKAVIRHVIKAGVIDHDLLPPMREDFKLQESQFSEVLV